MSKTATMIRRNLSVVALAAVAVGGTAVPAMATDTAGRSTQAAATVKGPAAGPDVTITHFHVGDLVPVNQLDPMPANRPISAVLMFRLNGNISSYRDVHFRTSNPGTAKGCDMSTIYSEVAQFGAKYCEVKLPALKPGEQRAYWVTMTGKRDGKPFSVTKRTTMWAPRADVNIYLNGRNITGQRATIAAGSKATLKYVVTNKTAGTITGVQTEAEMFAPCRIGTIKPGGTGTCSYEITAPAAKQTWPQPDLFATFGNSFGTIGTGPETVLVGK